MKLLPLFAGAAALTLATGAIAQETTAPAPADPAANGAAAAAATSPDAAAITDSSVAPSTATSGEAAPAPTADAAPAAPEAQSATTAPVAPTTAEAMQPDAAAPQTAMTAPAADPAKEQAADQMIAQNWSKFDPDNKGQLTPLEFGNLILAAQGNDMTAQVEKSRQSKAPNLPSTKVLNATAAEFSKADKNSDRMVSKDELKAYLLA